MKHEYNELPYSWKFVQTNSYIKIYKTLQTTQELGQIRAIIGASGYGKSSALKIFEKRNSKTTLYMELDKTYRAKDIYVEILRFLDEGQYGYNIPTRFLAQKVSYLLEKRKDKLLIIFDDAGRFTPSMMEYFQAIYDRNEGRVGIVLSGTSKFKNDFEGWVKSEKLGIPELSTRISTWVNIEPPSLNEKINILKENGIELTDLATSIAKECDNLRTLSQKCKEYLHSAKMNEVLEKTHA